MNQKQRMLAGLPYKAWEYRDERHSRKHDCRRESVQGFCRGKIRINY